MLVRRAALRAAASQNKNIFAKIKESAIHTWHGTKQFGRDVKIAGGLIKRSVRGYELTRDERRVLRQALADMFRMIPFSIIIIVPFMELLLPIILWLFPTILPSQFQSKEKELARREKRLLARVEGAKFLMDILDEEVHQLEKSVKSQELKNSAQDILTFVHKFQQGTPSVMSEEQIKGFKKFFAEELSLGKLSHDMLVALCKMRGVSTLGPDSWLRALLRHSLQRLRKDDQEIYSIGINNLSKIELEEACLQRGIRPDIHDEEIQRRALNNWVYMSLKMDVPTSLLLMAQAFNIQQISTLTTGLQKALESDTMQDLEQRRNSTLQEWEFEEAMAKESEAASTEKKSATKVAEKTLEELEEENEERTTRLKTIMAELNKRDKKSVLRLEHKMNLWLAELATETRKEKRIEQEEATNTPLELEILPPGDPEKAAAAAALLPAAQKSKPAAGVEVHPVAMETAIPIPPKVVEVNPEAKKN